jgi:hypothetical protein
MLKLTSESISKKMSPKEKSMVGKRDRRNHVDREKRYRNKRSYVMNDRDVPWEKRQIITENLHRKLLWQGEKSSADLSDSLIQKPHRQRGILLEMNDVPSNMVNQENIFNVRDRNGATSDEKRRDRS